MSLANFFKPIVLKSIASSTVSGTYAAINPDGTEKPCLGITILNHSSQDITISFDGIHDHDYLPTGNSTSIGVIPAQPMNNGASLAKGTIIYVKGTAGTGNIYLSGFYQG